MKNIKLTYEGDKRLRASVREHDVILDLLEQKGGGDRGPTPTEMFVASMSACAALYMISYMKNAGLDPSGMELDAGYDFAEDDNRVERMDISVTTPACDPGKRRKALISAGMRCLIHKTVEHGLRVSMKIAGDGGGDQAPEGKEAG